MKINRLLAIVIILLNREKISASELAEKFEVSVRTIYRDIDAINLAGIPIVSQAGNNGGFYIIDNYKINHQLLTLEDMISIVEALKNMNRFLEDKNVEVAIEKVKNIIPKEKKEIFDLHFEQMFIDTLPWGFKKCDEEKLKYKIIYNAVESKNCIAFDYINSKSEHSWRKVEPLTLVFKGFYWYLFSFCKLKNDYRFFKLSRMEDLTVLDERINENRISYKEYININKNQEEPTKVVLKFSKKVRYRVDDCFDKNDIKIQEDGSLIVDTYFLEDNWVYSMILSYGEYVEVLEPNHIREIIKNKCKKINNIYSNMT
ncbi:YafY family transcriptional regulator [Clostridium sporogenes]|uniref:helix-turn-helix transcriptional regulator n=1 Tax=Clostridium sporogenes TaxID=1509 RepID=UPI0013D13BA2|nr:YafY family protein [Clostridium sporogenes]EJP6471242.1 YafY family transcriptional regulator [Clostridium botulinum]NFV12068.1 YafY family transcriptional regulator [Clostridium sporogenes]